MVGLFEYARSIGIEIFSTPFDKSAVDFLDSFNPSAYKITSFEITDYELIRYTASKMKPIIISIGIATIAEIQDVVDICKNEGNNNIILLSMIANLAQTFGVVAGFLDHALGITAPIVATILGAKVIEKHFILNQSIGGSDCEFSLDI